MSGTQVIECATDPGPARWHVDRPRSRPVARLLLGHGAGGGVEAHDVALLAHQLPRAGIEVCRFEQPWRVAGRKVATPPATLDRAWLQAADALLSDRSAPGDGLPLIVGGRSAGARVACRTAADLAAGGVVTLAFPLHPPGRPERLRSSELPDLPLLAVQGGSDPFGTPDELQRWLGVGQQVLAIPGADHSMRVSKRGPLTTGEVDEIVVMEVSRWIRDHLRRAA